MCLHYFYILFLLRLLQPSTSKTIILSDSSKGFPLFLAGCLSKTKERVTMALSKMFMEELARVKESGTPLHKIAWDAGITPGMLYKISAGVDRPKRGDKKIRKLCAYLGISEDEAFTDDQDADKAKVA